MHRPESQIAWVLIWTLPRASCVTFSKFLKPFGSQFLIYKMRDLVIPPYRVVMKIKYAQNSTRHIVAYRMIQLLLLLLLLLLSMSWQSDQHWMLRGSNEWDSWNSQGTRSPLIHGMPWLLAHTCAQFILLHPALVGAWHKCWVGWAALCVAFTSMEWWSAFVCLPCHERQRLFPSFRLWLAVLVSVMWLMSVFWCYTRAQ